jgi:hypothetical protein
MVELFRMRDDGHDVIDFVPDEEIEAPIGFCSSARRQEDFEGSCRQARSSQPSSRAFDLYGSSVLEPGLHVSDHFIGVIERAEGAPGLDVGQAFGEPCVDHAALLGCVLVVRGRELRKDGDNPTRHPKFKVSAVAVAGPPANGRRHH